MHLVAEFVDNALRYSPPTSEVRVSAVHTGSRGLVIEVRDAGLGMTDGDLRIANTRLESGGEVTPYTTRHMGLFVVGRLARQHGLGVRLRASVAGEPRAGMTAGVFIPAELIDRPGIPGQARPAVAGATAEGYPGTATADAREDLVDSGTMHSASGLFGQPYRNGSSQEESLLPRRDPGTSGIVPDASAFFSSGEQQPDEEPEAASVEEQPKPARTRPPSSPLGDTDVIFQGMVSEWLIDPSELLEPMQSWESVWDSGWAAAAQAEEAPVDRRTDQGLPVREPGARFGAGLGRIN